jgi:CheY-like chemotaxis protein
MEGEAAVAEWARVLRPALVVLNARMPGPDAAELIRRLRGDLTTAGPGETTPRGCDDVLVGALPALVVGPVRGWSLGRARRPPRPAAGV